ncbi:hypothetical protein M3666_10615 [Curtobacterium sp. ODYSSEY 48 V2]|uniref:CBU_0592 family membrane protein n=1 Tax=Curtobacterium sp. ODYSSEY 48 V2 TaxID=2939561 RepID=UPI00203C61F8|nr:hypothetical protein [Curtobacterium sp. ODYSSEY 48 V2]MCM3505562.1 hypothetical protein [Curtobacterium sp. ODYSSEY 48 V2]
MLVGIVEFLGWFGAVTVLAGYLLFSLGKIPNGPLYQSLNLVGGLSVAVNVAAHHAIPSTIVNGIWAVIAVVVLVRMGRARRAARNQASALPSASALPTAPVLHSEPPTTTAVLPVVGPALRDHEAEPGERDRGESRLQDGTVTAPVAPMTESVPVITATIALALVAAAQHQATQGGPERHQATQDDSAQHQVTQGSPAAQGPQHAQEHAAR